MTNNLILCFLYTGALLCAGLTNAVADNKDAQPSKLEVQAKISRADAEKIALAKVAGGRIQKAELEKEDGKLIWSFDIATDGSKDITEIHVDARSGRIVGEEKDTPAVQAMEKEADAREAWAETLLPLDQTFTSSGRNDYFILEPGYQLAFEGNEGPRKVTLVVTVLEETRQVDGVETRVLEERESADGNLLEVSRNFFAVGARSHNVYYFGEEVDVYRNGKVVSHEGAWLSGVNGAKFGILVPGKPKVGDRYYSEKAPNVAMDRQENVSISEIVETPAGKFERCLKVKETTPLEPGDQEYKLYAPGIGLVQDGNLRLVRHGFVK